MGILEQILAQVDNIKKVASKNAQDAVTNPADFLSMITGRLNEGNKKLASMHPDAIQELIANSLPGGGMLGATRWQGSPNFIRGTKLDMSKLGTGEGAQVYGRGHYVAESPEVADRYRESLSIRKLMSKYLEEFDFDTGYLDSKLFKDKSLGLVSTEKKYLADLAKSDFLGYDGPARAMRATTSADAKKSFDLGDDLLGSMNKLGHLYKIDIPDEAVSRMINLDVSYGEQTEQVRKLIQKAAESKAKTTGNLHKFPDDYNAREILRDLGESRLNDVGIPGATYLDQGSRKSGGTTNNVLFNDDLARILERNGKPTGEKPWLPGEYDYVAPTESRKDEAVQNILKFIQENGVKL